MIDFSKIKRKQPKFDEDVVMKDPYFKEDGLLLFDSPEYQEWLESFTARINQEE